MPNPPHDRPPVPAQSRPLLQLREGAHVFDLLAERCPLWARCRACGRIERVDLVRVLRAAPALLVVSEGELADRLRCDCGERQADLVVDPTEAAPAGVPVDRIRGRKSRR